MAEGGQSKVSTAWKLRKLPDTEEIKISKKQTHTARDKQGSGMHIRIQEKIPVRTRETPEKGREKGKRESTHRSKDAGFLGSMCFPFVLS